MLSVFLVYLTILAQIAIQVAASPLKIFLLAGQSNMVGAGSIKHLDILIQNNDTHINTDIASKNEYREALWNGSSYKICDNVYVKFNDRHGPLTLGLDSGFAAGGNFGPELMFGWTMADVLKQVNQSALLLKTAWGGKSLSVDFRPPASGEGNYSGQKPIDYGQFYRLMITDILDTIKNISRYVPDYDPDMGYELSGFVWFQGWNDLINTQAVYEYGYNLANLIRDLRRDLDSPELPVIVGELGMHGIAPRGPEALKVLAFRAQQHSVTVMDEFRNTTLFVRTAPFAVLNGTQYNGQYHYYGRADTYFHIGQAFAKGMLNLTKEKKKSNHLVATKRMRR